MRSWGDDLDFRQLLREEPDVVKHLQGDALESLFDYGYYTRYVDYSFKRLGLEQG